MSDFDYQEDQMAVESQVDEIRERIDRIPAPKGLLISECLFDFLNFPKNQWKIWQISSLESKKWSNQQSKDTLL